MAFIKNNIKLLIYGVGTLISIFPHAEGRKPTVKAYRPAKSVEEAFRGDWARLGSDMNNAVNKVISNGKA